MKWVAAALLVLVCACGKKKVEEDPGDDYGCPAELTEKIVPQLVKTLDGGDADAFHRATEHFMQGTMCGPDLAGIARDWEQTLRETDVAKGSAERRALVVRLRDVTMKPTNDMDWAQEKKAFAPLFDKVK